MAHQQTEKLIRVNAKRLFAEHGYDGVSMRILATGRGVGLSSIYHFFQDKDVLLKAIYEETNRTLGLERQKLPDHPTAKKMLGQLINFQFDHIEDIVYVLKYYLYFRQDFAAMPTKTLPAKSVLHVEEVLQKGIKTGEFGIREHDIPAKARVVSHTINGYLLEYFPDVPHGKERREIVQDIVDFTMAGLA